MKDRLTAAETLVEEMQMEGEGICWKLDEDIVNIYNHNFFISSAQSAELTMTQQKLDIVQERLLVNVAHVEELQEKQEGKVLGFNFCVLSFVHLFHELIQFILLF